MASVNNEENLNNFEEVGELLEDNNEDLDYIADARVLRMEFGKGYDLSYFIDIRVFVSIIIILFELLPIITVHYSQEKYQGKRQKKKRMNEHTKIVGGIPSYPTRPALWLDFKKRKGTCSSRRTSIHNIVGYEQINPFLYK